MSEYTWSNILQDDNKERIIEGWLWGRDIATDMMSGTSISLISVSLLDCARKFNKSRGILCRIYQLLQDVQMLSGGIPESTIEQYYDVLYNTLVNCLSYSDVTKTCLEFISMIADTPFLINKFYNSKDWLFLTAINGVISFHAHSKIIQRSGIQVYFEMFKVHKVNGNVMNKLETIQKIIPCLLESLNIHETDTFIITSCCELLENLYVHNDGIINEKNIEFHYDCDSLIETIITTISNNITSSENLLPCFKLLNIAAWKEIHLVILAGTSRGLLLFIDVLQHEKILNLSLILLLRLLSNTMIQTLIINGHGDIIDNGNTIICIDAIKEGLSLALGDDIPIRPLELQLLMEKEEQNKESLQYLYEHIIKIIDNLSNSTVINDVVPDIIKKNEIIEIIEQEVAVEAKKKIILKKDDINYNDNKKDEINYNDNKKDEINYNENKKETNIAIDVTSNKEQKIFTNVIESKVNIKHEIKDKKSKYKDILVNKEKKSDIIQNKNINSIKIQENSIIIEDKAKINEKNSQIDEISYIEKYDILPQVVSMDSVIELNRMEQWRNEKNLFVNVDSDSSNNGVVGDGTPLMSPIDDENSEFTSVSNMKQVIVDNSRDNNNRDNKDYGRELKKNTKQQQLESQVETIPLINVNELIELTKISQQQSVVAINRANMMAKLFIDSTKQLEALMDENEDLRKELLELKQFINLNETLPVFNKDDSIHFTSTPSKYDYNDVKTPADNAISAIYNNTNSSNKMVNINEDENEIFHNYNVNTPINTPCCKNNIEATENDDESDSTKKKEKNQFDGMISLASSAVMEVLYDTNHSSPDRDISSILTEDLNIDFIKNFSTLCIKLFRFLNSTVICSVWKNRQSSLSMTSFRLLIRDLGIVDGKKCKQRDIDIIVNSLQLQQQLTVFGFVYLLLMCGMKRYQSKCNHKLINKLSVLIENHLVNPTDMLKHNNNKSQLEIGVNISDDDILKISKIFEHEKIPIQQIYLSYRPLIPQEEDTSYALPHKNCNSSSKKINSLDELSSFNKRNTLSKISSNIDNSHNIGISFESLSLFCRDFDICPKVIFSQTEISEIFNSLFSNSVLNGHKEPLLNLGKFQSFLLEISLRCACFSDVSPDRRLSNLLIWLDNSPGKYLLSHRDRGNVIIKFRLDQKSKDSIKKKNQVTIEKQNIALKKENFSIQKFKIFQ